MEYIVESKRFENPLFQCRDRFLFLNYLLSLKLSLIPNISSKPNNIIIKDTLTGI